MLKNTSSNIKSIIPEYKFQFYNNNRDTKLLNKSINQERKATDFENYNKILENEHRNYRIMQNYILHKQKS